MDEHFVEEKEFPFWTVSVFMVDRAYGGPEEGGWYFTYGEPVEDYEAENGTKLPLPVICATEEEAYEKMREWNFVIEDANKGRRSINSVLSEGEYRAHVCNGFPRRFPDRKPHYE